MLPSRIEIINEKFHIVEINKGKDVFWDIETSYKLKEHIDENIKFCVDFNFSHWKISKTKEHLIAYSIPTKNPDKHIFYEFQTKSELVIVPSWILQCALFLPLPTNFKYLYSLNGLEIFYPPLTNVERMSYFYNFPSAYQTWKSIFKYACDGIIGVSLPKADISCEVRGKKIGNFIYLNKIRILSIHPNEPPEKWVPCSRREFYFDRRSRIPDPELCSKNRFLPITEIEWSLIEPIAMLSTFHQPKVQRELIDLIVEKMASGRPWSTQDHDGTPEERLFSRMKADGRWAKIRSILVANRNTTIENRAPQIQRNLKDTQLLTLQGRWQTSKKEWRVIKNLLIGTLDNISRHQLRLAIDCIIEKLGTGKSWSYVSTRNGIASWTLQRIYRILMSEHIWTEIRSILCRVRTQIPDIEFPSRVGGRRLSNAEWKLVQQVVNRTSRYNRPQRTIRAVIDCILEKYGTGESWGKVGQRNGIKRASTPRDLLVQLKSDGRWQEIYAILCNSRGLNHGNGINVSARTKRFRRQ
ncbi:hypothetical protein [Paraburkholderia bannensis]|uniref:hypothetical protein n=1 Tax=Paraburkholderia bannensis TaxID=765414 RepID=UPI002AB65499|nr:hypothetical protein [Paraburkholderia bannensis]